MELWLEWARGPVFRACLVIMLLGLARVLLLNTLSVAAIIRRAKKNDRKVPYKVILKATLRWMLPARKAVERRTIFSLTSIAFHVAVIVAPIFLGAHILLWDRGLGLAWPSITNAAADVLTLIAIFTGLLLFIQRLSARDSRAISRLQDYLWPLLVVVPFASGFLAMHPDLNPFGYNGTMFVHVMSGNLILLLVPFSKLSHIALFPTTQIVSELGWFLDPQSGQNVSATLKKENEPI
jgi:nitrate reductase gamma subunit